MSEHEQSNRFQGPKDDASVPRRTEDDGHEGDLARRLRAEAAADRPDFSEGLHARIMASLPADRPAIDAGRPRPVRGRRWLAGSLSAAMLMAGVVIGWHVRGMGVGQTAAPKETAVAESDTPLAAMGAVRYAGGAEVGRMIDEGFARSQWAYLDHDARLAAELIMDQLPLELAFAEEQ